MERIEIETEFIKLDQFLKWAGIADKGSDANSLIREGKVEVNGKRETRRGKKLRAGDTVGIEGKVYLVYKRQ